MELEVINKLYLELSQVATAKTAREIELEDLLVSAHTIVKREGKDTAWKRFSKRLTEAGIGWITAKTFPILPSDVESREEYRSMMKQRFLENIRLIDVENRVDNDSFQPFRNFLIECSVEAMMDANVSDENKMLWLDALIEKLKGEPEEQRSQPIKRST